MRRGAVYLGSDKGKVKSIIDVGGQDTKAIVLDENGKITNFIMNDKCAAGTGRFIDVISRSLQEPMENFVKLSLSSTNPTTINSTCTVFAESEVISLIAKKVEKTRYNCRNSQINCKKNNRLRKSGGNKTNNLF